MHILFKFSSHKGPRILKEEGGVIPLRNVEFMEFTDLKSTEIIGRLVFHMKTGREIPLPYALLPLGGRGEPEWIEYRELKVLTLNEDIVFPFFDIGRSNTCFPPSLNGESFVDVVRELIAQVQQ